MFRTFVYISKCILSCNQLSCQLLRRSGQRERLYVLSVKQDFLFIGKCRYSITQPFICAATATFTGKCRNANKIVKSTSVKHKFVFAKKFHGVKSKLTAIQIKSLNQRPSNINSHSQKNFTE